jgi:hypothetical protein
MPASVGGWRTAWGTRRKRKLCSTWNIVSAKQWHYVYRSALVSPPRGSGLAFSLLVGAAPHGFTDATRRRIATASISTRSSGRQRRAWTQVLAGSGASLSAS